MTTRCDIPGRGTGPAIATYYVFNVATGECLPVSTPDSLGDEEIKLVAVPPHVDPEDAAEYLLTLDLCDAPAVASVIEFARRPGLVSTRPVHPEVAAALNAALHAGRRAVRARSSCGHVEFAEGHCGEMPCGNYYGKRPMRSAEEV